MVHNQSMTLKCSVDERLNRNQVMVFMALMLFAGDNKDICEISQVVLARNVRLSRGTVNKHIKQLSDCGYVQIERTKRNDGGNDICRYHIVRKSVLLLSLEA